MAMKRRFSLGVLAAAALLILGCQPFANVGQKWNSSGQDYIKLTIAAPQPGRAISVAEYQVTGLSVEVWDPDDLLVDTITWDAAEGTATHMIPVEKTGQYEIKVTHFGELNGETVEATESATFTIGSMVITVVEIVPGNVGMINVVGGTQTPSEWLIGTWAGEVEDYSYGPIYEEAIFAEDGTCSFLAHDANDPGGPLVDDLSFRGTYSVDGYEVTITFTGIWFEGEWHSVADGDTNSFTIQEEELNGNTLTIRVDFTGDGVPDIDWTLTRQ